MLDSSDKSKSLVCFAHDIFNVITPGQIFTQYYNQVLEGDRLLATVFNELKRRLLPDLTAAKVKQIQGPCLERSVRPELIWQNNKLTYRQRREWSCNTWDTEVDREWRKSWDKEARSNGIIVLQI